MNLLSKRSGLFLLISVFTIFQSCKSAKEKEAESLQSNLKTFFAVNLKDSTDVLDSFRLLKIDTITHLDLIYEQYNILSRKVKILLELYSTNTQSLSRAVDNMRLYRMINSPALVEIQKGDVSRYADKGKLIKAEIDTVQKVIDKMMVDEQKADTLQPVGFEAKCFYQLRNKDKSVKRDTAYIQLNSNKDIVKRKDFFKVPYDVKLDF